MKLCVENLRLQVLNLRLQARNIVLIDVVLLPLSLNHLQGSERRSANRRFAHTFVVLRKRALIEAKILLLLVHLLQVELTQN